MQHFPIFLDLQGKRVVVSGGGAAARGMADTRGPAIAFIGLSPRDAILAAHATELQEIAS